MNINKNNYEAFFLDYHEGNLTPQQVADLLLFIEQHSELKEEFESFENITLEDLENISFEDKSSLKKSLTPTLSKGEGEEPQINIINKDEFFIKSVENTLSPAEKDLLNDFIKQHPQYAAEFELFQKTKLQADSSIVFENKESLKRTAVTTDDLLIASVEGLLIASETILLEQQLSADPEMQYALSLYRQTKLIADLSVIYENKEELKRSLTPALSSREGEYGKDDDERKVIPLFYYASGIAAAILLLLGLFFFFNTNKNNIPTLAKNTVPATKNEKPTLKDSQESSFKETQESRIKNQEKNLAQVHISDNVASKRSTNKKQKDIINKKDSLAIPVNNNEQPINNIVQNKEENNQTPLINKEQPLTNVQEPAVNNEQPTVIAGIQNKNESNKQKEFLSLRELAAEKIKEKTLDETSISAQKKTGRLGKFNGWDFAQIVTKGISKLTGRNLEVKPTYNDNGVVTAYALGNNEFQVSKGR